MTENYEQSQHLIEQVRLRHPEWLRDEPDLGAWSKLKWDWTGFHRPSRGSAGSFWWRARNDPSSQARILAQVELGKIDDIRQAQKELKSTISASGLSWAKLGDLTSTFATRLPGWDGNEFECWRGESFIQWQHGLFNPNTSPVHREWVAPFLDVTRMSREQERVLQFWLYELEAENVPLEWLAWAFRITATKYKNTNGTAVDSQIGLYLCEAEHFVTCDADFVTIIEEVAREAPCKLATPHRVPDGPCLDELFSAVQQCS